MKYKYIFMDMDGTLFDFDKSERLSLMLALREHALPCTEEIINDFHEINARLWRVYETGEISRNEVQITRYKRLFEKYSLSADAEAVNELYKKSLYQSADLIDGARQICRALSENHALYIVSNGAYEQQLARLIKAGIAPFFTDVFISEQMGVHKPQREFFELALERAGIKKRSECLVVGDSPTSDIAGAAGASIDSCLFSNVYIPCGCTYHISRLEELIEIAD